MLSEVSQESKAGKPLLIGPLIKLPTFTTNFGPII